MPGEGAQEGPEPSCRTGCQDGMAMVIDSQRTKYRLLRDSHLFRPCRSRWIMDNANLPSLMRIISKSRRFGGTTSKRRHDWPPTKLPTLVSARDGDESAQNVIVSPGESRSDPLTMPL